MGLFDNSKKKREAKNLGLTVDQYDEYVDVSAQGMSIEEYKRYLSSFASEYSLEQFRNYLLLEKTGFNEEQCSRFLSELYTKIKLEDYKDFIEAEKLGLSVAEYAAYASSLKSKISAVDYVGFLKAQKIGITLGKYLQYLKSFNGEMTIEEYDIYRRAEESGMDREHYTEYLEKYKDIYTVERYLDFDKARSLGMTLEEYDLRLEASKAGMSLEDYKKHNEAKRLGMSDEEYSYYREIESSDWIKADVLTIPAKYTELPKNVFKHFSFREIVFPSSVEIISDNAFEGCRQLAKLTIPSTVKQIGREAFKDCSLLANLILEPGIEIISDCAFENCSSIREIFVPGTVKTVNYHVFSGCTALEKLEFEYGVGSIDVSEWTYLPNLKMVLTPSTASIKQLSPFEKNDARYGIINPNYKVKFGEDAKIDCINGSNYTEFGLPSDLSKIEYLEIHGDYVFIDLAGFANLKTVNFQAKGAIKSAENCPKLQMIFYSSFIAEIPPSGYVTTEQDRENKIIASKTLTLSDFNTPELRFLAVEDGAIVIDLDYYSASTLAWLHVSPMVSRLGMNTPALTAVAVHGNCKIFSDSLSDMVAIKKLRFDADGRDNPIFSNTNAKVIVPAEIANCDTIAMTLSRDNFTAELMGVQRQVQHILLSDNMAIIGDNAFKAWGLKEITIPSMVKSIGNNVFMNCNELVTVIFEGVPSEFGCDIFDNCSALKAISIAGNKLSVAEFADRYETRPTTPPVYNASKVLTEEPDVIEAVTISKNENTIESTNENKVLPEAEEVPGTNISIDGQFTVVIPNNYTYSLDPASIGANRALVAVLSDEKADLNNPYAATESITILIGKNLSSIDEAEETALNIGLENSTTLIDKPNINVRYTVKESGENLSIYLALICTNKKSFPTQIFFNNSQNMDVESTVRKILGSINFSNSLDADVLANPVQGKADINENKTIPATSHRVATDFPTRVLYKPGEEPDRIRQRIRTLFEKLDEVYPDKVIIGLHKDHKKWGETVTALYRQLGYPDGNAFLRAYGYTVGANASGRPTIDPMLVIEELKRRYPSGSGFEKVGDLKDANPDLASQFKSLQNQAEKFFGMTFAKYLIQEGLLVGKTDNQCRDEFETLKSRYARKPFEGTLNDLKAENSDIDWTAINRYFKQSGTPDTFKVFLMKEGILPNEITGILNTAFYDCENLTEITIPQNIGTHTFSGRNNLKKVSFDDGIQTITKKCLADCIALEEIILSDSIEIIEDGAFSGCSSLNRIILSKSLKSIGKSAFAGCTSLNSIIIPATVVTIGDNAFKDCINLSNVTMGTVLNFGLDVFANTPYIKKASGDFIILGGLLSKYLGSDKDVTIPSNVTVIGENSFAEAYHVESIVIPDSVKTIAKKIMGVQFYTGINTPKPKLKKLVIGNGVQTIGESAFENCNELEDVIFGNSITNIGQQAFYGCRKLNKIDLSGTRLREVSEDAFNGCYSVKELRLPETVERLARRSFAGISLGVVKLPKSVIKVDRFAFDKTSELIVYDTIDPEAEWADEWKHNKWSKIMINSPLASAMLGVPQSYVECQGNTKWCGFHITVLDSNTEKIRYRIFCDSEERNAYRAIMLNAWGKYASFTFEAYDNYFMKTRSQLGRTEMAFCRIQYPEGLNAENKANYEAFLERCLYIERSARRTAEMIANEDAVERLMILAGYNAIDERNLGWIREQLESKKAKKCLAFLDENYSK